MGDVIKPLEGSRRNDEKAPQELLQLPSLMIGGAVFSYHYNEDVTKVPTEAILSQAIEAGANAFDTSPYYGDSEEVMGKALDSLRCKHDRKSYFLITKCGRKSINEFDYSAAWVRHSIKRSLRRLRTSYIDVALLHDIEFTSADEVVEGISELERLRSEGLLRSFGLSGYNLPALLSCAQEVYSRLNFSAEVLFSYCHYNLENSALPQYVPKFRGVGVKHIINGSPLSMGLLRANPAPEWHPASTGLKEACLKASQHVETLYRESLADVALRYALGFDGTTCVGCSTLEELKTALSAWETIKARTRVGEGDGEDTKVFKELQDILVGDWDMDWKVPPKGFERAPRRQHQTFHVNDD